MPEYIRKITLPLPGGESAQLEVPYGPSIEAAIAAIDKALTETKRVADDAYTYAYSAQKTANTASYEASRAKAEATNTANVVAALGERVATLESIVCEMYLLQLGFTSKETEELLALGCTLEVYRRIPQFQSIGYDYEDIYRVLQVEIPNFDAAMDYAREIYANWDPDRTNYNSGFEGDSSLVIFPKVDMEKVETCHSFLAYCDNLRFIPNLNISNAYGITGFLCGQKNLKDVVLTNTGKVVNLYLFAAYCKIDSLTLGDLSNVTSAQQAFWAAQVNRICSDFNTSKLTNAWEFFGGQPTCSIVPLLDVSSVTNASGLFNDCPKLAFLKLINLGKSALKSYYFGGLRAWGDGSEENRHSLVDSLLTYSHDRAAAGMPTATVSVTESTRARLTDEEIAAITAKGFTLAS